MKLIINLHLVLRLRVAIVWKIPVFRMTPHCENWTLCSLNLSYPIPAIHIYTDYKLTGCCYVKLFQLKVSGGEKMPSSYNSHLLCCLCDTVTHFMCCDLWSDTAQLQKMVQCCQLSCVPALYTITTTYTERTHSSTENEVNRVQQWSSTNCSG